MDTSSSPRGGARKSSRPDGPLTRALSRLRVGPGYAAVRLVAALLVVAGVVALFLRDDTGGDSTAQPSPLPAESTGSSPAAMSQQTRAATAVLEAWSQPRLRYAAWWKQVSPLLTPGAREAYRLTNPRLVPVLAPMSYRETRAGPSDNTATVYFDTAAGRFGVDLSRRDDSAPWRAQRVIFPGGRSMFG